MSFREGALAIGSLAEFAAQDLSLAAKLVRRHKLAPYIGLVGYANLGDELLFQAHQALFADHKLVPYRQESILIGRLAEAVRRPFCSHAILGGGTLINEGPVWLGKTEYLLAHGTRMFCLGTGVGKHSEGVEAGPVFGRWVRALEAFEFIGVRGPLSKRTLDQGGVRNVIISGDTALSAADDIVVSPSSSGLVGINYGYKAGGGTAEDRLRYKEELTRIIKQLIAAGHTIVLLPIWVGDVESNRLLAKHIDDPRCQVVEVFDSYQNYADWIRRCDYFIGQKLHSTVIALMNRVPSIMLEYRPKCRDFMESLGLEDYIIRTHELSLESFRKLHKKLERWHPAVKAHVDERVLEYKHMQHRLAARLNPLLDH